MIVPIAPEDWGVGCSVPFAVVRTFMTSVVCILSLIENFVDVGGVVFVVALALTLCVLTLPAASYA